MTNTMQYQVQPQHQNWSSWNLISERQPGVLGSITEYRVYEGTWGERMIQHLIQKGYTMPHIAGIWDAIPDGMTYWEFIKINWVEV